MVVGAGGKLPTGVQCPQLAVWADISKKKVGMLASCSDVFKNEHATDILAVEEALRNLSGILTSCAVAVLQARADHVAPTMYKVLTKTVHGNCRKSTKVMWEDCLNNLVVVKASGMEFLASLAGKTCLEAFRKPDANLCLSYTAHQTEFDGPYPEPINQNTRPVATPLDGTS